MVHMINAHKAYDQLDQVQNYVFNLQSGDFRDGVLFILIGFKRQTKDSETGRSVLGTFLAVLLSGNKKNNL